VHSKHYRTRLLSPSYWQLHDGGGIFTLSTFGGDVGPSRERHKHTQVIMTPNIGSLPKDRQLPGTKSTTRLWCFEKSIIGPLSRWTRLYTRRALTSYEVAATCLLCCEPALIGHSEWVPGILLWNLNIGYLPTVFSIAEGPKRSSPIVSGDYQLDFGAGRGRAKAHSAWMTTFIRHAHAVVTRKPCQLYRAHAYERRTMDSSIALQATYSLDSMLAAARWP